MGRIHRCPGRQHRVTQEARQQVLGQFPEDFRGRVAVVGGGCFGEPVEEGG
jgi:hypothetical protein